MVFQTKIIASRSILLILLILQTFIHLTNMTTEEKKDVNCDGKLFMRTYGNKCVTWELNSKHRLKSAVPPKGVQIFYRQHYSKHQLDTVRVVAYVHDKSQNTFYYQTCVYHRDQVPSANSVSFSKKTHRYKAMERLMCKPMMMKIDPESYGRPESLEAFTTAHGNFTWEKSAQIKDVKVSFDWKKLEETIVDQLEHPPQKYYKFARKSSTML